MKPYYDEDGITIYHGDCREILPQLGKVDVVITDPPYGIKMDKGFDGFDGFGAPIARKQYPDSWDAERPDAKTFAMILGICNSAVIWGGNFFADILPQGTHWVVWDKLNTMPSFGDCELAWTNSSRTSVKKVTIEWNGLLGKEECRQHPTQKPIRLLNWCVDRYSDLGNSLLDPFMGSGTTLVAAKNLGRRGVGIEIEEKYCEIAARRLAQRVFDFAVNGHATSR